MWVVTACSQQIIPDFSSSDSSESASQEAASSASNEGFSSPIVAPPSYDNRPAEPGQTPAQETMPNGLPALKPLKGVNVSTLFSENITDTNQRFRRLENAVLDLRKEFEVMKPAIVRLVAVEGDIQALVQQLEVMVQQDAAGPAAQPTTLAQTQVSEFEDPQSAGNMPTSLVPGDEVEPEASEESEAQPQAPPPQAEPPPAAIPKVATSPPAAPPPADTSGGPVVQNLRTGAHPGKLRLVLDTNMKTPFTIDLDEEENFLLIEMPEARWQGPTSKSFGAKDALLSSYSVESINDGKGTRIILTLKKQTRILEQKALPPGPTPYHRVYVDLAL